MKNEFNEKYKVTNYRYEEEKKKIIQNNKKEISWYNKWRNDTINRKIK